MKRTVARLGDIAEVVVIDSRPAGSPRARIRDNAPHSHYALERDDIHVELQAFREVCRDIGVRPTWTVLEPFGGSGWHAALIQRLVRPEAHVVNDIAEDCVESIKQTLCLGLHRGKVICGDGYELLRQVDATTRPCWVHADYNLWTREKMALDANLETAWDSMWLASDLVTFTDTTPYELAPDDLGPRREPLEEYFKRMSVWIYNRTFGAWTVKKVYAWGPAAMYACVRSPLAPPVAIITERMSVSVKSVEES